jgi:hypothetical protein
MMVVVVGGVGGQLQATHRGEAAAAHGGFNRSLALNLVHDLGDREVHLHTHIRAHTHTHIYGERDGDIDSDKEGEGEGGRERDGERERGDRYRPILCS